MKYLNTYSTLFFIFLMLNLQAQIDCVRNLGGTEKDFFHAVTKVQTGYVAAGATSSPHGDFFGWLNGAEDAILTYFQTGNNCGPVTNKRFGGSKLDHFRDVITNHQGEVVAVGWSDSRDGDLTTVPGPMTGLNGWLTVLGVDGNGLIDLGQNQIFGGGEDDQIYSISQTTDNGYILAGASSSSDLPGGDNNSKDAYIIKLNSNRQVVWQRRYGSSGEDIAYSAVETPDGGIMFVGIASAGDMDVVGNHYGDYDLWIVKLDANGNQTGVNEIYGGTGRDVAYSIIPAKTGGGYLIGGYTLSENGNNNGAYNSSNNSPRGGRDMWILRVDEDANLVWYKRFGGTGNEAAQEIIPYGVNQYTVVGYSNTTLGSVFGDYSKPPFGNGSRDAWILTIDSVGSPLGGQMFGSPAYDMAVAGVQDGENIFAVGGMGGFGGNFTGGNYIGGEFDGLIFGTHNDVVPVNNLIDNLTYKIHPNPLSVNHLLMIDFENKEYSGEIKASFYNSVGQLVLSEKSQMENGSATFSDLSSLSSGTYFIKVIHEDFFATNKIVVLK